MSHPALTPDAVAVITGGAAGIGLAAATRLARLGLRICIADLGEDRLSRAAEALSAASPWGAVNVLTVAADVSSVDEVKRMESAVRQRFGGTDILINNAGVQPGTACSERRNLGTSGWRQLVGRDQRFASVRAAHDRSWASGPDHLHWVQARDYHPARRPSL